MDTDTEETQAELRGWEDPQTKIQSVCKVDTELEPKTRKRGCWEEGKRERTKESNTSAGAQQVSRQRDI